MLSGKMNRLLWTLFSAINLQLILVLPQQQIFVVRESLVADVYGLKTDKESINTLVDNIQEWGAVDKIISDCFKDETTERAKQILHALFFTSWYSEPYD
jgi:hypothetical protein